MGNSVAGAVLFHPSATLKAFLPKKGGDEEEKSALRLHLQTQPRDRAASTRALSSCPRFIQSVPLLSCALCSASKV